MFALSVEGPSCIDKGLWTTHKVLSVHKTRDEAIAEAKRHNFADGDIMIITDLSGATPTERVQTNG